MAIKLMDLFVKVSVDQKGVDRALKSTEKRAQQTEKSADNIGDGFQRSQKKATGALARVGQAITKTRNEARKGADFNVRAKLDKAQYERELSSLKKQAGGGPEMTVGVDLDTGAADAELRAWEARHSGDEITYNVDVDTGAATAKLVAFQALARTVSGAGSAMGGGLSAGSVGMLAIVSAAGLAVTALTPLVGAITAATGLAGGLGIGLGLIAIPAAMTAKTMGDAHTEIVAAKEAMSEAKKGSDEYKAALADLNSAMASMTGSQQRLYKSFEQFSSRAGEVFAPAQRGLESLGQDVLSFGTTFLGPVGNASTQAVQKVQETFGQLQGMFREGGPQRENLMTILGVSPEIVSQISSTVANLVGTFANVLGTAAPYAVQLATAIQDVSAGLLRWSGSESGVSAIQSAIEAAVPVFQALWDVVLQVGGALLNVGGGGGAEGLANGIRMLGDVLTFAINAFGWLMDKVGPLGVVFLALAPIVAGIALAIGAVVAVIGGPAILVIGAIIVSVTAFIAVLRALWPVLQQLPAALAKIWATIKAGAQTAWNAIKSAVSTAAKAVANAVKAAWNGLKAAATAVWNGIKSGVAAAWNGIKTAVGTAARAVATVVRTAWNGLKSVVSAVWRAISGAVKAAWNGIRSAVTAGANLVKRIVTGAWNAIRNGARAVWNGIKAVVSAAWKGIKAAVQGGVNLVKRVVTAAWNFIKNNTKSAWNGIKAALQQAWNAIKGVVSSGIRLAKSVISQGWAAIKSATSSAWNAIKAALQSAWNAIKSAVTSALNAVKSAVTSAWNAIKSATSSAWQNIKEAIGSAIDAAKQKIEQVVNGIQTFIKNRWEEIKNGAETAWKAVGEFIWKPIEEAFHKVEEFIGKIKGAVGDALSSLGISGGGKGDTKGDTEKTTSTTNAKGGAWKGKAGRQTRLMARGGLLRQFATGGIAGGSTPHAVYGEAGKKEYFIVPERADNVPYLAGAARDMGYGLMPTRQSQRRRGETGSRHNTSHRTPRNTWRTSAIRSDRPQPGRFISGHGEGLGPTHYNVTADVKAEADKIAAAVGGTWNTYVGHGLPGGSVESRTVDIWGPGGRGSPIGASGGFKAADMALASGGPPVLYIIRQGQYWRGGNWQSETYGDPHYDHTHISYTPNGEPAVNGGTSGGGVDVSGMVQDKYDKYIQPLVDQYIKPLEESPNQMLQFAGGAAMEIPESILSWLLEKAQAVLGAIGGALPSGSSPKGLTIGEALSQGGWPSNLVVPASGIVFRESGGNAQAQNPSGARGLMQIMPGTASGVGANYDQLYDPIYNTATGLKVYNQAGGWGPWVTTTGGDYTNTPVTGYTKGGMINREHQAMVHPSELYLPLDRPMVARTAQTALGTAELSAKIQGLTDRLVAEGINVRDFGAPASEKILVSGEGGAVRMIKSDAGRQALAQQAREQGTRDRIAGNR